jgi:hypothetical protein
MLLLGAAGALAILADPAWWPGVLAAIVLLAVREAPRGARRVSVGIAVLVLVLMVLPNRLSVAHQFDGRLDGDLAERVTLARNAEFVGRGRGAPPNRAALQANPDAGSKVGLAGYVLGDHSLRVVAHGTLSGAHQGLTVVAQRPEAKLFGLLAFAMQVVGAAFVLFLPRLRLLVVIPTLLALVPWFLANRQALDPFAAQAAFWPGLLVGAACLAYALSRWAQPWLRGVSRRAVFAGRTNKLVRRLPRLEQPAPR